MQIRRRAIPLIFLLATTLPPAFAEDDWEEDNKQGTINLQDGKFKQAEEFFLAAKKESQNSGAKYGHYATTLLNLGLLYDKMDKVPDSEKAYKEALAVYEKSYGDSSIEDSRALHGLAELYRHHNNWQQAQPLFQRALKIRDKLVPTHPDTAETLNSLGDVYRHQGKNADALPLFQRAVDIRKAALGNTHSKTAKSLDNLCATYNALGKYDQAVPAMKELLSARETALGTDDPKVAQIREDLAYAYTKIDNAKKADTQYAKALAIRQKNAKKDPAALASCQKRYGDFLRAQRRKEDADKVEGKGGGAVAPAATGADKKAGTSAPAAGSKPAAATPAKASAKGK